MEALFFAILYVFAVYGLTCFVSRTYRYIKRERMFRRIELSRANCCGSKDKCVAIKPCYSVSRPKRKLGKIGGKLIPRY